MHIESNDVLNLADRNGLPIVWISERLLLMHCDGLTPEYLRTHGRDRYTQTVPKHRREQDKMPAIDGQSWRWWKREGQFYYDYATIPNRKPAEYRSQLPEKPVEWHREAMKKQRVTPLEEAIKTALETGWTRWTPHYNRYTQQHALAQAAAVVEVAVEHLRRSDTKASQQRFWLELTALVKRFAVPYLPKNHRSLQAKIRAVAEQGADIEVVIDLPRAGNTNARLDDEEVLALISALRSRPQNYTGAYICRTVQRLCQMAEKRCPSWSWVQKKVYADDLKMLTAVQSFGARSREANRFKDYIRIAPASFASDCWIMDATRVNMIPCRVREMKNGVETWVEKSVFMVAVTDVHSLDTLAMTFTFAESRWAYRTLLEQAVRAAGHLPYEIVCDRFPGHNSEEGKALIERLRAAGVIVTITHEATGKAKQERWWRTLQSLCFQQSDWYYGEGIQSKDERAHRSAEHVADMKKLAKAESWTDDDLVKEVTHWLGVWRNTPLKEWGPQYDKCDISPSEMFKTSAKPNVRTIAPERFAEMFGHETMVTMTHMGTLRTIVGGVEMIFKTDDFHVIRYREGKQVVLCFDLDNPETGYIFEPSNTLTIKRYIGTVRYEAPVMRYGPNADWGEISRRKARRARLETEREQALAELIAPLVANPELEAMMAQLNGKRQHEAAEDAWLGIGASVDTPSQPLRSQHKPALIEDDQPTQRRQDDAERWLLDQI